eukprot:2014530-Amphidinium_carterae.1
MVGTPGAWGSVNGAAGLIVVIHGLQSSLVPPIVLNAAGRLLLVLHTVTLRRSGAEKTACNQRHQVPEAPYHLCLRKDAIIGGFLFGMCAGRQQFAKTNRPSEVMLKAVVTEKSVHAWMQLLIAGPSRKH